MQRSELQSLRAAIVALGPAGYVCLALHLCASHQNTTSAGQATHQAQQHPTCQAPAAAAPVALCRPAEVPLQQLRRRLGPACGTLCAVGRPGWRLRLIGGGWRGCWPRTCACRRLRRRCCCTFLVHALLLLSCRRASSCWSPSGCCCCCCCCCCCGTGRQDLRRRRQEWRGG
jgi:hypothetical protein